MPGQVEPVPSSCEVPQREPNEELGPGPDIVGGVEVGGQEGEQGASVLLRRSVHHDCEIDQRTLTEGNADRQENLLRSNHTFNNSQSKDKLGWSGRATGDFSVYISNIVGEQRSPTATDKLYLNEFEEQIRGKIDLVGTLCMLYTYTVHTLFAGIQRSA